MKKILLWALLIVFWIPAVTFAWALIELEKVDARNDFLSW